MSHLTATIWNVSKPKDLLSKAIKQSRHPAPVVPKDPTAQELLVGQPQRKEPNPMQVEGARVLRQLQRQRDDDYEAYLLAKAKAEQERDDAIYAAVKARSIG